MEWGEAVRPCIHRWTRESDWGKNSCYYKYSRIGYLGDIVFDDFSKWNTHQWFFFKSDSSLSEPD